MGEVASVRTRQGNIQEIGDGTHFIFFCRERMWKSTLEISEVLLIALQKHELSSA